LIEEAVMPAGSSPKRERQYEHIKDSAEKRGVPAKRATEIAARTVNKERARAGESRTASRSSTHDVSSSHRGGKRSHTGSQGRTKQQLYNEAKQRNIKGRSAMSKAELEKALAD
jgi:plasmid stabilization system protein ParE